MAGRRRLMRAALGLLAGGLAIGPLAATAAAQDTDPVDQETPPPDLAQVAALVAFYGDVLAESGVVTFDANGVPRIPEGEPGERDQTPANTPEFGAFIGDAAPGEGFASPGASGSSLVGHCGGMAMSFAEDGSLIDMAVGVPSTEGGGPTGQLVDVFGDGAQTRAFTTDNPFEVDDLVVYVGTLPAEGDGPREHDWSISTAGISVDSGGDPNDGLKNRNAGEVDLGSVPDWLRPAGIFDISGELTSQNGLFCEAEGWVKFSGANPLVSAPSAVAAAFGITGVVGLLFNSRPAITWKG